jgi:hypothetical protein
VEVGFLLGALYILEYLTSQTGAQVAAPSRLLSHRVV